MVAPPLVVYADDRGLVDGRAGHEVVLLVADPKRILCGSDYPFASAPAVRYLKRLYDDYPIDGATPSRLAGYSPDLLMEISTNVVRTYDFHRATEVIEIGRRAALDALASRPFA